MNVERVADTTATPADVMASLQRTAGNRATSVYAQLKGEPKQSVLDRLVKESRGNFIGNVDEEKCLKLIAQLNPSERTKAAQDNELLKRLASAFNVHEMVPLCDALPLTLAQKIFWCKQAGVADEVNGDILGRWIKAAPESHIVQFLSLGPLVSEVIPRLALPPAVLLTTNWPGPKVCELYAKYPSMARWLARATSEVVFSEIAQAGASDDQVKAARQRLSDIGEWSRVIDHLGGPNRMTKGTRAAVRRVAWLSDPDAKALFAKRFGHSLKEGDAKWTAANIRGVWDQLDVLPDSDVSQNTVLKSFKAIAGDKGFWSSPNIELGDTLRTSTMGPTRLPHTVRHEVGHAVHDLLAGAVNSWLRDGVGFWPYPKGGRSGVRSVVADLGGYPATYVGIDGKTTKVTDDDRELIDDMLSDHVDTSSSWTANTPLPVWGSVLRDPKKKTATKQQKLVLLWEAMPQKVQDCFEGSKDRWYQNWTTHPYGTKGFTFWNHWYSQPYHFSATAKAAINATGDPYSAMSEKEFFANCYAEFFEDPAGAQDHTKWGGSLNADIQNFFRRHIVERQPYKYVAGAGAGPSIPKSPNQVERP